MVREPASLPHRSPGARALDAARSRRCSSRITSRDDFRAQGHDDVDSPRRGARLAQRPPARADDRSERRSRARRRRHLEGVMDPAASRRAASAHPSDLKCRMVHAARSLGIALGLVVLVFAPRARARDEPRAPISRRTTPTIERHRHAPRSRPAAPRTSFADEQLRRFAYDDPAAGLLGGARASTCGPRTASACARTSASAAPTPIAARRSR